MAEAIYQKSARVYDLLYTGTHIVDFAAGTEEVRAIIQQHNPMARSLLDVACGTGQHLARLRAWYDVAGVDLSPAMLAVARRRLGGDVPLRVGDMRTFDLGRRFDAVICMFSSIGYMTTPEELHHAFERFATHLAPGGVLIVDGWVRPDAWHGQRHAPDFADDGTTAVVRWSAGRRDDDITVLDMHHWVQEGTGDIDYFVEQHTMRLVRTEEYASCARAAGLVAEVVTDYMPGRDRIVAVMHGR